MLLQILKKSTFFLCAGAMLVFTSCNGDDTESIDAGNATETENGSQRSLPNMNGSGSESANENNGSQTTPSNTNTQDGAIHLNPPHGEPGHDCAIEVGQPLNSSGAGAASPMMNTPKVNIPKANSGVRLNPEHGEPGHDCAVPVGDPLN